MSIFIAHYKKKGRRESGNVEVSRAYKGLSLAYGLALRPWSKTFSLLTVCSNLKI
jgi:hypothetical protein